MRLLADQSVDMIVVRALRSVGHDVRSIAEERPRASDDEVLLLASSDQRLTLTEDRGFGQLVYTQLAASEGVICMRYPARARAQMGQDVVDLIRDEGEQLHASFVVIQPGRARISRLPDS